MMWTERNYDHERDEHKNYIEPGPSLTSTPSTALEIALLVKAISVTQGAELIEQYARVRAAEGRLEGVAQAYNRVDATLNREGV